MYISKASLFLIYVRQQYWYTKNVQDFSFMLIYWTVKVATDVHRQTSPRQVVADAWRQPRFSRLSKASHGMAALRERARRNVVPGVSRFRPVAPLHSSRSLLERNFLHSPELLREGELYVRVVMDFFATVARRR